MAKRKQESRENNLKAAAELRSAIASFSAHLKCKDILCLDAQFKDELIDLRHLTHGLLIQMNPVIDEGIKSISAQSVSGKLSR